MKILIIGGDGYLGWPTAMHLSKKKHQVYLIDDFSKRSIENQNSVTPLENIETMENRVTTLEEKLQKQEQVLRVELEVQRMRQEQIIDELKSKSKMDSLRFAAEMVQQEYLIKLQNME